MLLVVGGGVVCFCDVGPEEIVNDRACQTLVQYVKNARMSV